MIAGALKNNVELAADVLIWTFRFALSRHDPPWHDIRRMQLLVPTTQSEWIRADQAILSKGWGGDDVELLDDLLTRAADLSSDLGEVRQRLLAAPTAAPFGGHGQQQIRRFLVAIGVRSGLWPVPVPNSLLRANGNAFQGGYGPMPAALTESSAELWREALAEHRPDGLRPYTDYVSKSPLYRLPGQDDHRDFPSIARLTYARLIAHGLAHWPDETLTIKLRRYNDSSDKFSLPTPARAALTQTEWVPISPPGDRTRHHYVRPDQAWSHTDDAPPFAAIIASIVRRQLQADQVSQASRGAGSAFAAGTTQTQPPNESASWRTSSKAMRSQTPSCHSSVLPMRRLGYKQLQPPQPVAHSTASPTRAWLSLSAVSFQYWT